MKKFTITLSVILLSLSLSACNNLSASNKVSDFKASVEKIKLQEQNKNIEENLNNKKYELQKSSEFNITNLKNHSLSQRLKLDKNRTNTKFIFTC